MEEQLPASRTFHILAKPVGPACNLGCKYCFYREKETLYPANRQQADWIMPEKILEEFVRRYIASQPAPVVSFAWQGGEPTLLGVDYFRKAIELQNKYANGKRIENTFQTNGVLLDDEWCEFLAANHFLVGLSIDGPRQLHDRHRVDRGGAPSFDKVMRGGGFLKKHGVEFNTLTVVPRYNAQHPLEVYRFLKEIGSGFMQFIPIVERVAESPTPDGMALISPDSAVKAHVSEWSVEPLQYGKFLCAIFDDWVRKDVGKIFVQLFDVTLAAWIGLEPGLCVFQRSCGSSVVIEHNGDIYSCDHYVYPENRLGNIMDQPLASILDSPQQIRFGQCKLEQLPHQCLECKVRFICNGECPKHRFIRNTDGEEKLNYLCRGYKHFFTHVAPYMDFMAAELRAERPAANVMAWMRNRDLDSSDKAGRNDPCQCGSGLKFKRCCGKA
jgi:uncharacterized protein